MVTALQYKYSTLVITSFPVFEDKWKFQSPWKELEREFSANEVMKLPH